ncbi:glycolate oxidase subunit GlcE [Methylovirgula ligni]|uniref:Glycolate oxidase FAD binding subunit n=1 Tax=Methylovirgula ligni TaxID=569860 RepID=A0A3D9YWW5_9HYPH|nr:glycolate oxidase subunit GlcE [Methylovirgula ligni]QAY96123.1 glycolate oxidase subunit GlcE [Methylovirgula ligni]REF86191.1 glycolate oxidase FAD binding subunit [Methylovirgula ligni]
MNSVTPKTEAEAAEAVNTARAARRPLGIEGGGTRAGLGRPVAAQTRLSTRGLTGITLYEPSELVISARAGTPLNEIEAALKDKNQALAFEPMDHRALYGTQGEPTLGGIAAGNISGPRRISAGAARDFLIGLRFVNGRGEIIKTGGRVMKNVTGLDLVKLLCGSHGTLGVITEATFKVLPHPASAATLALYGLADGKAVAALCAALGSPLFVSAAAHLPAGLATPEPLTLFRLEGPQASVDERLSALRRTLAPFESGEALAPDYAGALWRAIRNIVPLVSPPDAAIWRISVQPTRAPKFVDLLLKQVAARYYYDWGGGLVWLSIAATGDAGAAAVRAALVQAGNGQTIGHATLVRAPDDVRRTVDVFEPLAAPLLKLTKDIKASFDPDGILNPGRMYAGI